MDVFFNTNVLILLSDKHKQKYVRLYKVVVDCLKTFYPYFTFHTKNRAQNNNASFMNIVTQNMYVCMSYC